MKQTITVRLNDDAIEVQLRQSRRATRLILKLDPKQNVFNLTKPPRTSEQSVRDFIVQSMPWMKSMHEKQGQTVPFAHDNIIPVLGVDHKIQYAYADTPHVTQEAGELRVTGFDPIIIPGLVKDWLRAQVFRHISDICQSYARQVNREIYSIQIKDTASRWGSCSRNGKLSFSWRLVFAPNDVIRYVCAHEVAHLEEMNHSSAFWAKVEELYPDYATNRLWLKQNGKTLFRYG